MIDIDAQLVICEDGNYLRPDLKHEFNALKSILFALGVFDKYVRKVDFYFQGTEAEPLIHRLYELYTINDSNRSAEVIQKAVQQRLFLKRFG